jgi:hypothetical protein
VVRDHEVASALHLIEIAGEMGTELPDAHLPRTICGYSHAGVIATTEAVPAAAASLIPS